MNDLFLADESSFVVLAAGMHATGTRNGDGWDYNTITVKKIADIVIYSKACNIDDTLYDTRGDCIIAIDLTQIMDLEKIVSG